MSYGFTIINTYWAFVKEPWVGDLKIQKSELEVLCTDSTALVSDFPYTCYIPSPSWNPSYHLTGIGKDPADPTALGGGLRAMQSTKACWLFLSGFHSSDRRQYSDKPGSNFANNYRRACGSNFANNYRGPLGTTSLIITGVPWLVICVTGNCRST
jgi:hypothetical protein